MLGPCLSERVSWGRANSLGFSSIQRFIQIHNLSLYVFEIGLLALKIGLLKTRSRLFPKKQTPCDLTLPACPRDCLLHVGFAQWVLQCLEALGSSAQPSGAPWFCIFG